MKTLIFSIFLSLFAVFSASADTLPSYDCVVVESDGYFLTYGPKPSPGATAIFDLAELGKGSSGNVSVYFSDPKGKGEDLNKAYLNFNRPLKKTKRQGTEDPQFPSYTLESEKSAGYWERSDFFGRKKGVREARALFQELSTTPVQERSRLKGHDDNVLGFVEMKCMRAEP